MDFQQVTCLEYQLRRFLSRCPELVHRLSPFLQEVVSDVEDDVNVDGEDEVQERPEPNDNFVDQLERQLEVVPETEARAETEARVEPEVNKGVEVVAEAVTQTQMVLLDPEAEAARVFSLREERKRKRAEDAAEKKAAAKRLKEAQGTGTSQSVVALESVAPQTGAGDVVVPPEAQAQTDAVPPEAQTQTVEAVAPGAQHEAGVVRGPEEQEEDSASVSRPGSSRARPTRSSGSMGTNPELYRMKCKAPAELMAESGVEGILSTHPHAGLLALSALSQFPSDAERLKIDLPQAASLGQTLSAQGHAFAEEEEEVANAVAELFLHPKYTVPLIGCLRCIAQKIVEKVLYKLKLVLVPYFRSSSELPYEGVGKVTIDRDIENLGDTVNVINYYSTSGREFVLHHFACLAFSRAVGLIPDLLRSIQSYFDFAPPPFERINRENSVSELLKSKDGAGYLLDIVCLSYRLLLLNPEDFSHFWNWSIFLDLVEILAGFCPGSDDEMKKTVLDLRWCVIQILSIVLKTSERSTNNFGLSNEEAFTCLLRWQEYCQDVSLERAGWHLEAFNQDRLQCSEPCSHFFSLSEGSKSPPSKRSKWAAQRVVRPNNDSFVLTTSLKKSYEMVQLAVSQRWSVLLYGPAGSGKTKLISELAWENGSQVLSLHMDDQIDGKTLIGSYVCTERPGEFRWQPGSLTQAVMNGFWVVFEDIDKAPADVQSILLPLLEGSRTFVTFHGEEIRVAEGFQLFSTISSSNIDTCRTMEGNSFGNLWRRVMIPQPINEDMKSIVKAQFPMPEIIADQLIETFDRVNRLGTSQFGSSVSVSRFSLRDLLKWCKRISHLGFGIHKDGLSDGVCNCIYLEAVDVFASFSTSTDDRLSIMKEIAIIWNRPSVESLFPMANPAAIKENARELKIGRAILQRNQIQLRNERKPFVELRSSLHNLEKIACCVNFNEPVLLVGETGTGKTTLVQSLAMRLGQRLTVLNLSQQSDVADLLGGFKPTDAQHVCIPLYNEFESLYTQTFQDEDFLSRLKKFVNEKKWKMLLRGFQKCGHKVDEIMSSSETGPKRKRKLSEELEKSWFDFSLKLRTTYSQINDPGGMIFSFVEGAFVNALRTGDWILLDEVNLAPPETLQRILGVLEEENGSLCLAERGDINYVKRHHNFRIFACMNPATDAGKRDLPYLLRSRFTEFFVDDKLDDNDLILFINQFITDSQPDNNLVNNIVQFYKAAKESEQNLQDGANQKPQYSLRSLYRALEYVKKAKRTCLSKKQIKDASARSLYDGFCMFFLTLLDKSCSDIIHQKILYHLLGSKAPSHVPFDAYLTNEKNSISDNYVLTKSVKEHLGNLARAIFVGKYPVLLQGPTSSGKTSLVKYLATITGHEFVRINNHEHTDLQEYLGSYITDSSGKLVFHEGVLVKAVRNGHWIVLDELNLAPSDVLEALNRLLDDNRELFVPELGESIRAHPNFLLFATQNPPTIYGGRKMLSRAFRNRFVEIQVDEIPREELITILEQRCEIAKSYAEKMVLGVMEQLQLHRPSSKVFAGKHGFITPRDLFRWADRYRVLGKSYEDFAKDGYYLLAERQRDDKAKTVVQDVLQEVLKVKLITDDLYKQDTTEERDRLLNLCKDADVIETLGRIAWPEKMWTGSIWRLYFLIKRCYEMREPVLLVGETGGGKTTVCQLLSLVLGNKLHILNCHQYTEASDFLGGFYPYRERSRVETEFKNLCGQIMQSKAFVLSPDATLISTDVGQTLSITSQLANIVKTYKEDPLAHSELVQQDIEWVEKSRIDLVKLHHKWKTIFIWQDGPLIEAMKNGDLFLVDEISLADDSVLERLNSVLEPERKLALAEKGGPELEKITAHPDFFLLATMNPGGDYGKKELSPALRNRFTEIWVPPVTDGDELRTIARHRISDERLLCVVNPLLDFYQWFNQKQTGRLLTVRDLLSWIAFMNKAVEILPVERSFLHGAFLVLLDGLSLGTSISKNDAGKLRERCLAFLLERLQVAIPGVVNASVMDNYGWAGLDISDANDNGSPFYDQMQRDNRFGFRPFSIPKGEAPSEDVQFAFEAPTTRLNALRMLRAMQLSKPVLLEGSPGVGKTSLIVNLGKISRHNVVRINLSEQTDMMDLLGSDLPVESDDKVRFSWSDGILLQAIKNGSWVLLDELNLAPQSVLEGLNAILDHRSEVFIPELGVTFKCPPSFRVFACQNPTFQGGGRKGLPKSFLNRFTKVYVDELVEDDYLFISRSNYPEISKDLLSNLIKFNKRLHEETMVNRSFAQVGFPWEFNLRDVTRSCQIIKEAPEKSKTHCFLNTIYIQRMRTAADREKVACLYEEVFGIKPVLNPYPRVHISPKYFTIGDTCIERNLLQAKAYDNELKILPILRHNLESVAVCVQHNWLCILVGSASSGKTSLIRLLSQLTGNALNELNLSSASDISELLGGFEQYNAFRHYQIIYTRVQRYLNEYFNLRLEGMGKEFRSKRKDYLKEWLAFSSKFKDGSTASIKENLPNLKAIIEYISMDIKENSFECKDLNAKIFFAFKDLNATLKTIELFSENCKKRKDAVKFEWVTGMLVKAIENGEWIVLENANLCNPTILDRINSLVEPQGSITVNECGTVDGKPLILTPHPNFRIFLTVDPSYGEVSRAMRNRGVEISVMPPYWLLNGEFGKVCDKDIEFKDVERFLVLSGIPLSVTVESMAKAHIYARVEGMRINVKITYLELGRWVQLYKQLISRGNQPVFSLQLSWEHTYLSSLGAEAINIINNVIVMYLSRDELYKDQASLRETLSLPGGWPTPLTVGNYVGYSRESTVRQNCMYLEYLGSQYACFVRSGLNRSPVEIASLESWPMFPHVGQENIACHEGRKETELALIEKKLLFAANWVIEQATENDQELYVSWFNWFASRLETKGKRKGLCNFFNLYLQTLKKELKHCLWEKIVCCRGKLLSHYAKNVDSRPVPILSLEMVDLFGSDDETRSSSEQLTEAINCVGILRVGLKQWQKEEEYLYDDEKQCFRPFLKALSILENKAIDELVGSSSFDWLFGIISTVLEDHELVWEGITLSKFESSQISWRSLVKNAMKLRILFKDEVANLEVEGRKLNNIRLNSQRSLLWVNGGQKSLLWVNGGHPSVPSSANLYQKQQQLLSLCQSTWKSSVVSWKKESDYLVKAAVSSIPELRLIAVRGVCMSSYILGGDGDSDSHIVQQLEEMYQAVSPLKILLKEIELEEKKLENTVPLLDIGACCTLSPTVLCTVSGFDSWLNTVSIIDNTSFFLNMELLKELSKIVTLDTEKSHQALVGLSGLLESTFNYMVKFSSRPPSDILSHQKILWTVEARKSFDAGVSRIASFVLEMWFSWHSALWTNHTASEKLLLDGSEIPLPDMLFKPVLTDTIDLILQSKFAVKDYRINCLKLRVGSNNLWQKSPKVTDVRSFLLCTACHLFQQIICSHKKAFKADKYNSLLCYLQNSTLTGDDIKKVAALISSSGHSVLASEIDTYIKPVLGDIYGCSSSTDTYTLGCAWVRVGALRYRLLIACDDLDPARKNYCKYTKLVEKIHMLELDNEVRKESIYLAGGFSSGQIGRQNSESVKCLKAECEKLKRKIVYRSDPGKFKKLRGGFVEFLEEVKKLLSLIKDVDNINLQQIKCQVYNCQGFLDRLSSVYSAYADIIQPVEVAVYEIKLGLCLLLSNAMQNKFLKKVREKDMESVLEKVHSFMKFPRSPPSEAITITVDCEMANFPSFIIDFPTEIRSIDTNLLENLVTSTRDGSFDDKVSLHHNFLLRVAQSISEAQLMDDQSFKALVRVFGEFANLWMKMKTEVKTKEESEAQQYKFRPRAFKIESIIELDISTLGNSLGVEVLSEWQELLSEEDSPEKKEKERDDNLEQEWSVLQDSIMNGVVHVHNQIFGSKDLIQNPGIIQLSEAEEFSLFINSYTLGVKMIKGLKGVISSDLDVKLTPEHLFRLCLEHENKFNNAHESDGAYNFYKDSNASVMAKMVERVKALHERILSLSAEMESIDDDHPAILKIINVVEMILAIPLSTPLAKALSGLQFLVNRVQVLQDAVPKFRLSDELEPIYQLISSWHKLEFESWPALLDEVQIQFENNAARLWFPLYSVLRQSQSDDKAVSDKSTIGNLEEFIQSSSVGEFKKRLQLLLAYYGYISVRVSRDSDTSWHENTVKVLYNIFGFYMQYLPIILEHVENTRNSIEKELTDVLKLCRWDRPESYVSIENSKRTRQKFQKLVQKYTDVLQQPILLTINRGARQCGMRTQSLLPEPKIVSESFDKNMELLNVAYAQAANLVEGRPTWFMEWRKNVNSALQSIHLEQTPRAKEIKNVIGQCLISVSTCTEYQEKSKQLWCAIESISRTAIDCANIWKDDSKILGKRRVLTDILKLLEDCGLAKHRSIHPEDFLESGRSNCWLLQPSYEIKHLLRSQSEISIKEVFSFVGNFQSPDKEWRVTNEYYFKSITSFNFLQQICLNFHKDFTTDQVHKSRSYLDHLLEIQQKQRKVSYKFANKLSQLRKCASLFEPLSGSIPNNDITTSDCSFAQHNFDTINNYMWQQKQILGSLCSIAHEVCLLLKTVEGAHSHLYTCQNVEASASRVRYFIEKFIPEFQKSKDLLDFYLLGHDRVTTTSCVHPRIISKQMEQLVKKNVQITKEFEKKLNGFLQQDGDRRSVKDVVLGRFEDVFKKVNSISEDFECALQGRGKSTSEGEENTNELGANFSESLEGVYKHIVGALHSIMSHNESHALSEDSVGNITESKKIFKSYVSNMKLDAICEAAVETFNCAGKLLNHHSKDNHPYCHLVEVNLKRLHSLLNLILTFGDCVLREFLNFHGMVSVITHALSDIFASLYSKGFGIPNEEQDDENDKTREIKAPGLVNGCGGPTDISDQIENEDQIPDEPNKEKDEPNDVPVPSENKGIEMERDFEADTYSVSEDSGNDENDDGEETPELDSKMGETGENSENVDEKLCDKDDKENSDNKKEKNETGPSVKDTGSDARELRAKEESDTEFNMDEFEKQEIDGNENENGDEFEGTEDMENMNIDEKEDYAEPTGLNVDEPSKESEDINMDEQDGVENEEEDEREELDERGGNDNGDDNDKESGDVDMDEGLEKEGEHYGGENVDKDDDENEANDDEKTETPSSLPKEDVSNPPMYDMPSSQSGTQPKGDSFATDLRDCVPNSEEAKWSSSSNHNDLAPNKGLPNSSDMEVMLPDSSSGGKINNENPQNQLPQHDNVSSQKVQPNPLRNIGDALEEWKERVKVSIDAEENNTENQGEDMDEGDADEYGYTTEFDKGTAQALGPATADQMDTNVDGEKPDGEGKTVEREEMTEVGASKEDSETGSIQTAANIRKRAAKQMEIEKLNEPLEELEKVRGDGKINGEMSESLVSVKRSYMSEDIRKLGRLSLHDTEMANANNNSIDEISSDMSDNAKVIWRKYEQQTTSLSQELAEQLRLVMEPTLASKLQGDYKTGKRINMKKVIPYIASHYRKDKIWLRRTRPNKRNYQVVIAVDDSGSMSENRCGDVAIEALVTVSRAMAQLEVGDLAVASFGKGGNVQLLHDFDGPFTRDSGEKMISNLTFKQENTIADSPVGDLLKYVNSMLDAAVINARLPSGQNPLQQLVLIIADGSFHEENLKRYVRDVLSKKRMIAFILLDSQEESIMDRKKVSITGGKVEFSRYMDSFPFPYYIVLRNIEALPRTLADLLRQWFELMQNSRD